jgi:ABC-2 type transport system permease protein
MNLRKLWLVAASTYKQQVRSTLFLVMTFALPLIAIAAGAIPVLLAEREAVTRLGWVDETDALALPADQAMLLLTPFEDADAAAQALEAEQVDAYLVIPEGYLAGASPVYYGSKGPNDSARAALRLALRQAVAPEAPQWLHDRLARTAVWEFRALDKDVALHDGLDLVIWYAAPPLIGMLYAFMLLTTVNHMGPAIIREKEERAMEIVLTSLRPVELVGGKIVGLALLTLTQAVIWGLGAAAAIGLLWWHEGRSGMPLLPWGALGWGLALAAPNYLLFGALGAGLGILAGDREQAKQIAGLVAILGIAPVWFISVILTQPDGPAALVLTLIPVFSPVVALIRMTMTEVPTWQLWAALGLLWASVIVGVMMVARLFRAAALMYGQRLAPRQIWRALLAR